MAPDRVHEGRLVVLLYCIAIIPVYFLFFFAVIAIDFSSFGAWAVILVLFTNPFTYIIVWEVWMLLFANRIANAYSGVKNIISFISIRYNLYYGLTALFFLFAVVFPLATPVVSSLVIGSLVWRLVTARHDWDEKARTPGWVIIVVAIVMIVPVASNMVFYIEFIPQATSFWMDVYIPTFIPVLKNLAKSMATAATLGSVIYMFMFGTSEYELLFEKGERPREVGYIRLLQVVLFVFFLFLVYFIEGLFNIIQFFVIGINILIILGNLRNRNRIEGVQRSIISYMLVTVLFIFSVLGQGFIESIILVISSLLYMATFLVVFIRTVDD